MEEFLLLGQIPGTNLVITFGQWALIFSLILTGVLLRREIRRNHEQQRQLSDTQSLMSKRVDATILDQVAL